jgi:hypothetical protein
VDGQSIGVDLVKERVFWAWGRRRGWRWCWGGQVFKVLDDLAHLDGQIVCDCFQLGDGPTGDCKVLGERLYYGSHSLFQPDSLLVLPAQFSMEVIHSLRIVGRLMDNHQGFGVLGVLGVMLSVVAFYGCFGTG